MVIKCCHSSSHRAHIPSVEGEEGTPLRPVSTFKKLSDTSPSDFHLELIGHRLQQGRLGNLLGEGATPIIFLLARSNRRMLSLP